MADEQWRRVADNSRYEVSNLGRVRRNELLQPQDARGYQRVRLFGSGESHRVHIHRLVMEAFVGPCPPGHECNHKDGNKTNNAVENLEYVTPSVNNRHAYEVLGKKTQTGSTHGMHVLVEADVRAIRDAAAAGETGKSLAQRYRVTKGTISMILSRRTWRHI